MQCPTCGCRMENAACPRCRLHHDLDLRQTPFHDLGLDEALPCPSCGSALAVIEFQTQPALHIERCRACQGMFFNPGELETLLDVRTQPQVRHQLAPRTPACDGLRKTGYRKCPLCAEHMNYLNFGRRSGVILDCCATHGVWVAGSELRRLTEWWRAGGKAAQLHIPQPKPVIKRQVEPDAARGWESVPDLSPDCLLDIGDLLEAAVDIVASFITD